MTSYRLFASKILFLLGILLVYGCGGGGGSATPTATVTGTVFAGPTNGASVTVRNAAGEVVAGPVTSRSDGSYTIAIPVAALASDLVFEASGGTFDDEADEEAHGRGVPLGTLSAYIAGGSLAGGANVSIDPASTIIRKMVASGKSKAAADNAFNAAFGYTPDCSVKPAFVNMSTDSTVKQRLAGLRIAAFSQLTQDLINDPAKQFELIEALGEDIDDDLLDGRKSGSAVATTSGFAIPEDISNRFVLALVRFQASSLNKSKLTADKIGVLPFNKTTFTTNYKVEYIPGTIAATQGRTDFKIKLTNRADGTAATGKSVTLVPYMYMATKSHTSPSDPVIVDNGDGTYSCTVYYVMSSMANGMSMGIWQIKVLIGGEEAYFFPSVAMSAATNTSLTKLTGINDAIASTIGPEKRTYFLFRDGLAVGSGGSYTFNLFLATKESLANFPAVVAGNQLLDQAGAAWTVNTIIVEVSTDGTNWVSATDTGNGHWSATGLTGLSSGVAGKIYVKVTVNGEQKTTNGSAVALDGTNGYQAFNVIP